MARKVPNVPAMVQLCLDFEFRRTVVINKGMSVFIAGVAMACFAIGGAIAGLGLLG